MVTDTPPHTASATAEISRGILHDRSPDGSTSTSTRNYQDEAESHDSKLKAIWDENIGDVKKAMLFYRTAVVLLLSWHPEIDDLHTDKEVVDLQNVFQKTFKYETVRKILIRDPRRTAQAQVNKILSDFVFDHDDTHTLLIIYYAGHGRPEESSGGLKLAGSRSLVAEDSSELHEIVWSSAEHNIRATKSDVLVIFDCCYAGELERNVRSTFTRRAFEYLAATSAKSTTRKPGKHSFTTALIWALNNLVTDEKRFTTQELLSKILMAPGFPEDQSPRLSERGPACLRRIVLAPLNVDTSSEVSDSNLDDEDDVIREDLSLRFVFNKRITEKTVAGLAVELRRLIGEGDFKTTTILWEGINFKSPIQFKDMATQFHVYRMAHKWWDQVKRKGTTVFATNPTPQLDSSGSGSWTDSPLPTPASEKAPVEPEISQDEGITSTKTVTESAVSVKTSPAAREKPPASTLTDTRQRKRRRQSATSSSAEGPEAAIAAITVTPPKRPRRGLEGLQDTTQR